MARPPTCLCCECHKCKRRLSGNDREYYARHRDEILQKRRASHEVNREKANEWFRTYRKKMKSNEEWVEKQREIKRTWAIEVNYEVARRDRVKRNARRVLQSHVKQGKIARGNCEVCGQSNEDAHHEDYLRPLEVRWFCKQHHADHHRLSR